MSLTLVTVSRHEPSTDALYYMGTSFASTQHGGFSGLHSDGAHTGLLLLQELHDYMGGIKDYLENIIVVVVVV